MQQRLYTQGVISKQEFLYCSTAIAIHAKSVEKRATTIANRSEKSTNR